MPNSRYSRDDLHALIPTYDVRRMRASRQEYANRKASKEPTFFRDAEHLAEYVKLNEPCVHNVTDAAQLAVMEQLRREAGASRPFGREVPTDVFVFWPGEPQSRAITKIGGLPYWPACRPWPHTTEGDTLGFIAQVSFSESSDIVGPLPGDLLLIFGRIEMFIEDIRLDDPEFYWRSWNEPDQFHFEWVRFSDTPLVTACEHPLNSRALYPYWAQCWRTVDYPDANGAFSSYNCEDELRIIHGTKIGGVPPWIQGDPALPGRFLFCLYSFSSFHDYFDHAPPLWRLNRKYGDPADLTFDDLGAMFVKIDNDGICHATVQSH